MKLFEPGTRALVLGAHTDDEFGCAGTIARSQADRTYLQDSFIRSLAIVRGLQINTPAAEAFEAIRINML